ncbi:MAG: cation transporter substrate-binding protein [Frankiales bacterium]|nr:cation transporter substrate-binding protein [Frankiales bacterium]
MRRRKWAVTLAVALITTACGGSAVSRTTASGALKVVAVENVWGDVLRQIGGSHVAVTSILKDPSVDPHTYETDPRAAAAVSSAAFVVLNGLRYDEFASKLLRAGSSQGRTVLTVSTALGLSGDQVNPHLWYSPTYVRKAVSVFQLALAKADPAHATDYANGAKAFLAAYQPYVETLAAIRRAHGGEKVAYTERVPGYLLQEAGLSLGIPASFPQAIEDGTDPSAADVDAVSTAMRSKAVKVLLYNGQVTSPATDRVKKLAADSGVAVVAVTETLPADQPDFQTWQLAQARAVQTALAA